MPTFIIIDTYKITDKGYILSGKIIGDGVVLTGDNAVMINDPDPIILKIIGVHTQNESKHFGLLISFDDFGRVSSQQLKGTEVNIVSVAARKPLTKEPISWTGDFTDDCTANWAGLMLRAEWMDENYWWWAVYDMQNDEITIDSSNDYRKRFVDGEAARKKAEEAAKKYLSVN